MVEAAPIFIIGTERSGSNLLRLILNSHSAIAAPHPPHFMAYFGPLEYHYGDLRRDKNLKEMIDHLLDHVRGHIHPWPFEPQRSDLLRADQPRDLFSLSYALYDQFAAYQGKPRWACKSTHMIHYVDRILARYPSAKLIWLVRDPRDVAHSSLSSVFNPFHPYHTAMLWRRQQEIGLELESRLPAGRLVRLHYEDLVGDAAGTVARLCAFLGVAFEPTMLAYFDTPDARLSAALSRDWSNTASPVIPTNAGKFRSGLSEQAVAIVEAAAGPVMEALGYDRVARAGAHLGWWDRVCYACENEFLRARVELVSIATDRNALRRWRRSLRIATYRLRFALKRWTRRQSPSGETIAECDARRKA